MSVYVVGSGRGEKRFLRRIESDGGMKRKELAMIMRFLIGNSCGIERGGL